MNRVLTAAIVGVALLLPSVASSESPAGVPAEVLALFQQSRSGGGGNWWTFNLGGEAGACTVNWGANGKGLLIDGRRFSDTASFTALMGWYAATGQIMGLCLFETGDSLLFRANVRQGTEHHPASLEGQVTGTWRAQPVRGTFVATRSDDLWSVEVFGSDGRVLQGAFGNPRRVYQNVPAPAAPGESRPADPPQNAR